MCQHLSVRTCRTLSSHPLGSVRTEQCRYPYIHSMRKFYEHIQAPILKNYSIHCIKLISSYQSTLPIYEHQIFQIMPSLVNLMSVNILLLAYFLIIVYASSCGVILCCLSQMYGSSETMILTITHPESNPLPTATRQEIISSTTHYLF